MLKFKDTKINGIINGNGWYKLNPSLTNVVRMSHGWCTKLMAVPTSLIASV